MSIGRPVRRSRRTDAAQGRRFAIVADGLSLATRYVASVSLNGRPLKRSYVTDAEIRAGGELRFVMSTTPNTRWATGKDARAYSMSTQGQGK